MKKKSVKKLSLKTITVARLSADGARAVLGGAFTSGPSGPSGPTGATNVPLPDPCATQYQACTMCCTLDCSATPGCQP
ncbi:class I lanthipeptide [Chitinophaga solisilvae]|uniref:Uncharacterized protein n=1 Tax=Chitinophaga solisilvae TaxID=1233460 RepID=A0A9Q5D7N5_9BACT|nr:class I lanthipeptide [Chitinophaga solisilvae]NSL87865.1 hypothetical protein [Chitinophaga solisilvae]NSL91242.1 hypothetical protein [Chitinophaga solisilvae]